MSRFVCPVCGQRFELSLFRVLVTPHVVGKGLRVTCPGCHTPNWLMPVGPPPT